MRPSNRLVLGVLALSVVGISFAAPLVRLSHAHAVVIATWRLFFSLIIVAVALAITGGWRQWRTLDRTGLALATGAGVLLALHFWAWNASIALTTIAASTVLVDLQPVLVAGASAVWLREAPIDAAVDRNRARGDRRSGARRPRIGAVPPDRSTRNALLGDLLALRRRSRGGALLPYGAARAPAARSLAVRGDRLRRVLSHAARDLGVRRACRCCISRRASSRSSRHSRSVRCCSDTRE